VPGEFARILREGIEQHVSPGETSGPAGYLLSRARLTEADAVGPCVARLATAEVQPPDGPGVGRGARARRVVPLGTQLGLAAGDREQETLRAVRGAVLRTLAVGYGGMIDLEAAAREGGRSVGVHREAPEVVWNRWVATLGSNAVVKRVHRKSMVVLNRLAIHALHEDLSAAGVAPPFRSRKLRPLAWFYVEAGLSLRAMQTDLFPDKDDADADAAATAAEAWPFGRFPESLRG
jgi:hypothetical protein